LCLPIASNIACLLARLLLAGRRLPGSWGSRDGIIGAVSITGIIAASRVIQQGVVWDFIRNSSSRLWHQILNNTKVS
jgi:hypothetical protein